MRAAGRRGGRGSGSTRRSRAAGAAPRPSSATDTPQASSIAAAGAHLVGDRADPADAGGDVGGLGVAPAPQQRLEEARRLEDVERDVGDHAVVHRARAAPPRPRPGRAPSRRSCARSPGGRGSWADAPGPGSRDGRRGRSALKVRNRREASTGVQAVGEQASRPATPCSPSRPARSSRSSRGRRTGTGRRSPRASPDRGTACRWATSRHTVPRPLHSWHTLCPGMTGSPAGEVGGDHLEQLAAVDRDSRGARSRPARASEIGVEVVERRDVLGVGVDGRGVLATRRRSCAAPGSPRRWRTRRS